MLGEVNHLMKGLTGPMLKSVGTGGDHEVGEGTGLLDGGATHPLRQGTIDEIKNAVQVTVPRPWFVPLRVVHDPIRSPKDP